MLKEIEITKEIKITDEYREGVQTVAGAITRCIEDTERRTEKILANNSKANFFNDAGAENYRTIHAACSQALTQVSAIEETLDHTVTRGMTHSG